MIQPKRAAVTNFVCGRAARCFFRVANPTDSIHKENTAEAHKTRDDKGERDEAKGRRLSTALHHHPGDSEPGRQDRRDHRAAETHAAPQVTPQVGELLSALAGEMRRETLQAALGLQDRKSFRARYLKPALADGLLEMTIPDKPNSRLQKYRLTDKGRQWLALQGGFAR